MSIILWPTNSFGTVFHGTQNNFDKLRLTAALAVLFGHSFVLTAGVQTFETMDPLSRLLSPYAAYGEAIQEFSVNLFFVISGFLVTCPYLRSRSLLKYALARPSGYIRRRSSAPWSPSSPCPIGPPVMID